MTKEQVNENPIYVVEEEDDEEETFTLDFDNNKAYQKEEHLIVTVDLDGDSNIDKPADVIEVPVAPLPPVEPFKNELQDFLLNSITSKAIASLLDKRFKLDSEIFDLIHSKDIGDLGRILESEIGESLYKRRTELRKCYVGNNVKYENIPSWAKSYIKEYIQNMVHGLVVLTDDSK